MFNPHLYPAFNSVATFPNLRNDNRASRLILWRDSLDQPYPDLPPPPDNRRWSNVSALKKLSYLPARLSRLKGLRHHLDTKVNIMIPSIYRSKYDVKKFFYLIPRNVTITYGPYHYLGILDYRLERLHGLQTALKLAGANVHLRAVQHINHVSVWYLEKEIFSCKITNLHHGGDGELDQLCYNAAVAFARRARKVSLHIKHKYKYDKEKSELFKNCPCHPDHEDETAVPEDDEECHEEFHGEDDYYDTYHFHKSHEDEGERSEEEEVITSRKRLRRIYFQPLTNRRLMPRIVSRQDDSQDEEKKIEEDTVQEDEEEEMDDEFAGEDYHGSVDDGPKGGSLHIENMKNQNVYRQLGIKDQKLSFNRAYNRLRV